MCNYKIIFMHTLYMSITHIIYIWTLWSWTIYSSNTLVSRRELFIGIYNGHDTTKYLCIIQCERKSKFVSIFFGWIPTILFYLYWLIMINYFFNFELVGKGWNLTIEFDNIFRVNCHLIDNHYLKLMSLTSWLLLNDQHIQMSTNN